MTFTTRETAGWIEAKATIEPAGPESIAEAERIAAQFPKSIRVKASTLRCPLDGSWLNGTETFGTVFIDVDLTPNEVTGEANETGLKRWASFNRHCKRLGYKVEPKS